MKHIVVFFLALSINFLSGQISNRIEIAGQIIVEGDDLENITIYNITADEGTLSDADGTFRIPVKVSDTIQVRALQYQDFDVIINQTIVNNRRLSIFLIQEINQLDEIIVSNRTFSGQLNTDMKSVKTFTPKMDAIYFGVRQEPKLNESPSDFTRSDIVLTNATAQNKPLVNGLNIINVVDQLLLPLFRAEVEDKEKAGIPEVPVKAIKYYLGSEFLSSNFDIPKYRVEEFIRYVERENFDFTLLNYGRELEFLELLNQKSQQFLKAPKPKG